MFLQHNDALVPPYRVLIDTNFINFSLQNKLELIGGMMDCLYAKCESYCHFRSLSSFLSGPALVALQMRIRNSSFVTSPPPLGIPCVTDCVMAELEKLGHRYRVALRCADPLCTPRNLFLLPSLPRLPYQTLMFGKFYAIVSSSGLLETLVLSDYRAHMQAHMPTTALSSG